MKWASALVNEAPGPQAHAALVERIRAGLLGMPPHLVLIFGTPDHLATPGPLLARLAEAFPRARIVGGTAAAVIGEGREHEGSPALSALAAWLPDVEVVAFRATQALTEAATRDPAAWHRQLGVQPDHQPCFVLLSDPWTGGTDALVQSLDAAYPAAPKVGGLLSGGRVRGSHRALLDQQAYDGGAVGVALYGDVVLEPVVATGARPFGPLLAITATDDNRVLELDAGEAATTLRGIWRGLPEADQRRFQRMPLVGLTPPDDPAPHLGRELLLRQLLDLDGGALALAGPVEAGQYLRFFLRDAEAADLELRDLLARWRHARRGPEPAAALLITCVGRGRALFGLPDHDADLVSAAIGGAPTAGFFANGELGRLAGATQLHTWAASVAFFRSRGWS